MIMNVQTAVRNKKSPYMVKSLPSRIVNCEFVGSYFSTRQIPDDSRPQVAFAGRSNVGKSTLLNHLVGRKKMAKVSRTPGKTQSINFFLVNDRFYFVDLPGYGYARVPKKTKSGWQQLIEDYLAGSRFLIGLILLLDSRRDLTDQDKQLLKWLAARNLPVLGVLTKTDKISRDEVNRKVKQLQFQLDIAIIAFSALTNMGKKELLDSIHNLLQTRS